MSIKARLSVAILGVAGLAVCLFGGVGLLTIRSVISAAEIERAEKAQARFLAAVESRAAQNESLAELLATSPAVQQRVRADDRPGLLADLAGGFARLKAYGVNNVHFHRPNTTTLLRLHAPNQYDDDLSALRPMIVTVNRTGRAMRGVELGVNGLPIRGAVPIVGDDGRHLGVVEVGSFINADFLKAFEEDGTAYTVFFVKDGGFDVFAASPAARAPRLSPSLLQQTLAGGATVAVRSGSDTPVYLSTAARLRGVTGEAIGAVQIDIDTSLLEGSYMLALRLLFAGLVAIGIVASIAALATIAGILRPLEHLLKAITEIGQDRFAGNVPLLDRGDELGELARAVDSFRTGREDLRRARDEAQMAYRVLQDIIDHVPAVVNFKDTELRYVAVNRACAEFYGVEKEDMIGRRLADMTSGLDMKALERSEREVMETGRASLPREFKGQNRAGRAETWWTVKGPVRDRTGRVVGLVTVALDFTDLKEAQQLSERSTSELKAANRQLEQQAVRLERLNVEYLAEREAAVAANRAKTQFLANMSHELRTPLNAVIGYSEVLAGEMFGPMLPRYLEYSKSILAAGQHLLEIINDILDMSRIEAGSYDLEIAEIDLSELTREALRLMRAHAEQKRQDVRLQIDESLQCVRVDRRAIKQVIINLVGNAIKFTQPGGWIEISASRPPSDGIEISVRDNGPGIGPDHIPHVFEAFWQGEDARTRKHEGTGLGLYISKKLVEMHGGTIRLESIVGVGTAVTVMLPPSCVGQTRT